MHKHLLTPYYDNDDDLPGLRLSNPNPNLSFPFFLQFSVSIIANHSICEEADEGKEPLPFSTFAYDFQPYGQVGLTSSKVGRGCNLGDKNLYNEYEKNDRRLGSTMLATADGNYYYSKKYVDLTNPLGYGGNNWIELRFADVFLMLAESYERTNQVDLAKSYLDKVRVRGSLPKYDIASVEYHTAYPTLRAAIFHERRTELAFENQRWFDLQRLYPTKTDFVAHMQTFDGPKYKLFQEYELLLPIPYEEVQINPDNFKQNPGY